MPSCIQHVEVYACRCTTSDERRPPDDRSSILPGIARGHDLQHRYECWDSRTGKDLPPGTIQLRGAESTFAAPLQKKWLEAY
jgi:hypothetical protein